MKADNSNKYVKTTVTPHKTSQGIPYTVVDKQTVNINNKPATSYTGPKLRGESK